jgi:hypothetical protein
MDSNSRISGSPGLFERVSYAPIAHRENECEFAVAGHGCSELERSCAGRFKYVGLLPKVPRRPQRPMFPDPVSASSEPEEYTQKRGQASIQRDDIAHSLIPQGDIQAATGKDNFVRRSSAPPQVLNQIANGVWQESRIECRSLKTAATGTPRFPR